MNQKHLWLLLAGIGLACSGWAQGKKPRATPSPKLDVDKTLGIVAQHYSRQLASYIDTSRIPRTWEEGRLRTVRTPDWTSGFYAGTLWYLYQNYQNDTWLQEARLWSKPLFKEQYNKGTHDLGFMLYCPLGLGYSLMNEAEYKPVLIQGSKSLISRYRPKVGLIRSWDHRPVGTDWQYPVIVDNMMNLEMLFWASKATGDSTFAKVAITHANNTLANHFRPNGSSFHVVDYDTAKGKPRWKGTHQGYANASAWARGQAWGFYGYVVCYRETKNPAYLEQARKISQFIFTHRHLPADGVPYWDFNAPDIPEDHRDASAAAIIASALLEMSTYTSGNEQSLCRQRAEKILSSLASPAYLAAPGSNGNFALLHSVGHKPGNSEVDVPLNYADYYFVEALLRYKRLQAGQPVLSPAVRY